jgi:hypothetical protein
VHHQTYRNLANARDFMRHAYQHPINLPDISAQANLSPYHFLRVHKLAYGETPHEFLTRLRIDRAKTLLARGGHNVTEACFEVERRDTTNGPSSVRPFVLPRHALRACQSEMRAIFEKKTVYRRCYLQGEATTPGGQP